MITSGENWKPHPYQKKALKFLLEHQSAGLLLDPGLGKTSVVLAAFSFLKKKKLARKMLVVAPLRVCHMVWPDEVKDWKDFQHLKLVVLHGKHKEERLEEDADVYVINPEGLPWLLDAASGGRVNLRRWRSFGFDTLVLDELTKWKHSRGKRFKLMKQILNTFQRRWGLTGTPAPNGLLDLFGQMYMLDDGAALGRYITHYRNRFFVNPDMKGWKWVPQSGAPERIYTAIKPLCLRMEAEDYLDLPQNVPIRIEMDLPPAAAKLYDKLEEDLIAQIEENSIVASNAASASIKLRQICNGAVYVDDDVASLVRGKARGVLEIHDEKLRAVEDLIDELQGQPLLLAYEFKHDLSRLQKHFGKDTPYIGSGVSEKKAREIEQAWNAGELPLLLGQPASMGHGLNFQKGNAAHVGWFSMFWDLELYDQFLRRVLRQGNKADRVFNYHFIMKDTVDKIIFYGQRRKERGQKALSDALKDIKAQRHARGK